MIDVLTVLLTVAGIVILATLFTCWLQYDNPANFLPLLREARRPALHHQQRVQITGGYYASYTGTLLEREDANYRVDIDGVGKETIAIRHLRPLLPPALLAPKETEEECNADYPALPPFDELRERE